MESKETLKSKANLHEHNSFEQYINYKKTNLNFGSKNNLMEKEKSQNVFINKYLEEADLNEIYNLLYEINSSISMNVYKKKNKNCCNNLRSCSCENKHLTHNKQHSNELNEILYILKKPLY